MTIIQVNRFVKIKIFERIFRYARRNQTCSTTALHPLESRKLVKLSGDEVSVFLQGLVTNDMRHFDEGAKSIYTMFLNHKGRVLYETLIHKLDDAESYFIECDKAVVTPLQRHLKMFKLKRKIDIEDVSQEFRLWALTNMSDVPADSVASPIKLYKDPRLNNLGLRVVAPNSMSGSEVADQLGKNIAVENNEYKYKYLRYELGVSEGVQDVPPGVSFPLEANCDYLHGVSFHKGCYIGQELTARVYHTGVVRKRLMPLKFDKNVEKAIDSEAVISVKGNPKSNVGKLKGSIKDCGLALVRIKEATEADSLTIGEYTARVIKPSWWPVEAPKEKLNVSKI